MSKTKSITKTKRTSEGKFMTVNEVASKLRLSDQTIRDHILNGRIKSVRMGKVNRIPTTEFLRLEKEGI